MDAYLFIDDSEFERLQGLLRSCPDLFRKACKAALKRVGGNMRRNIGKGMRGQSYLRGKEITGSIGRLQLSDDEAKVRVAGRKLPVHNFKLIPNRVTARKGKRSVSWPEPRYKLGPKLKPRYAKRDGGKSKGFIFPGQYSGKLIMGQRLGKLLEVVYDVAPQYFAAFEEVKEPVMDEAQKTFMSRLEHEIDYRLGLGR